MAQAVAQAGGRFLDTPMTRTPKEAAEGRLPLIGVGGIASGQDAWERLRGGASAIQIYSALIYDGPGLVGRIKRDLAARLRAEGFSSVAEAVSAGPLTER